jgi:hypothetical protein
MCGRVAQSAGRGVHRAQHGVRHACLLDVGDAEVEKARPLRLGHFVRQELPPEPVSARKCGPTSHLEETGKCRTPDLQRGHVRACGRCGCREMRSVGCPIGGQRALGGRTRIHDHKLPEDREAEPRLWLALMHTSTPASRLRRHAQQPCATSVVRSLKALRVTVLTMSSSCRSYCKPRSVKKLLCGARCAVHTRPDLVQRLSLDLDEEDIEQLQRKLRRQPADDVIDEMLHALVEVLRSQGPQRCQVRRVQRTLCSCVSPQPAQTGLPPTLDSRNIMGVSARRMSSRCEFSGRSSSSSCQRGARARGQASEPRASARVGHAGGAHQLLVDDPAHEELCGHPHLLDHRLGLGAATTAADQRAQVGHGALRAGPASVGVPNAGAARRQSTSAANATDPAACGRFLFALRVFDKLLDLIDACTTRQPARNCGASTHRKCACRGSCSATGAKRPPAGTFQAAPASAAASTQ